MNTTGNTIFVKGGATGIAKMLLVALFGLSFNVFAESSSPYYFPLEKGTCWIYRGETKFLVSKADATEEEKQKGVANEEKSEVLTWKMEVVDTLERPHVFAALIKGGPWDLAWYKPGKARGDYLILRIGDLRYYQYSGTKAQEVWDKLRVSDARYVPSDIEEGELMLDFPLAEGKVFGGDFSGYIRSRYCWVVEGERKLDPKCFPGAKRFPKSIVYTLTYRTNPDHQFMDFATGVGIVSFTYGHHGTLAATDIKLIDFRKGKMH